MRDRIQELLAQVDFEAFYRSRLQKAKRSGNELTALCPLPSHSDKVPSFSANIESGLWKCFGCSESGSVLQFIERMDKVDILEAIKILEDFAGISMDPNPKPKNPPKNDKPISSRPPLDPSLPEKYLANLLKTKKTLLWIQEKKGLSPDTIKKYKIGFDGERITIPVYDEKGVLGNIRRYSRGKKPKILSYHTEKDGKVEFTYGEGRIYGLREMLARPDETVTIFEGEWDRLLGSQDGFLAVTGTVGAGTWKPEWTEHFRGRHVIIIYDMDSEGKLGAENTARALVGVAASVTIVELPLPGTKEAKDYTDYRLKVGASVEDVEKLVEETPLYVVPPKEEEATHPYRRPVFELDGKYQKTKWKGDIPIDIPISNFLIIPKERIEFEGKEFLRAEVRTCQGIKHPNIQIPPDSWSSKPRFKNSLSFLDLEYIGSDDDIQNIGGICASKDAPRKQGVIRTGLHRIKKRWIYAEEKLAWDAKGQRDDIVYLADDPYKVNLLGQPDLNKSDLDEILSCMFHFNAPDVIYPLTAWCFACFVKERIIAVTPGEKQNPMLIGWGEKGAGKSQTLAVLIKRLFGIQMTIEDINVPTEFSFAKVICSSSLAPVIYDEYKIGKINDRQQKIISSMMTSVYNQRGFTRGKANLGLTRWTYSAPVVISGEMKTPELAIQDRIVEVYFSKKKIEGKDKTLAFKKLKKVPLGALGKDFLIWTLKLTDREIKDLWQEQLESVDRELMGRLGENTAHARVGLALFSRYLESRGYKKIHKDAFDIIDETQKRNILKESNKTVVDTTIEAFSIMAGATILNNTHFRVDSKDGNERLNLHISGIYPEFKKWARERSWDGEVMDYKGFTRLLQGSPYYLDHNIGVRFDVPRKAYVLDPSKMRHLEVDDLLRIDLGEDYYQNEKENGNKKVTD